MTKPVSEGLNLAVRAMQELQIENELEEYTKRGWITCNGTDKAEKPLYWPTELGLRIIQKRLKSDPEARGAWCMTTLLAFRAEAK